MIDKESQMPTLNAHVYLILHSVSLLIDIKLLNAQLLSLTLNYSLVLTFCSPDG